ncbi:MAG: DUF547 domain-containing protein [Myxococcota bacterium]
MLRATVLGLLAGATGCATLPQGQLRPQVVASLETFDYRELDGVLRDYVDEVGRVDYARLQTQPEALDDFLDAVASVGPMRRPDLFPTVDHQLAFYLNAYNSLAIRNVIHRYPYEGLTSLGAQLTFFILTKVQVDGQQLDLNHLEHQIIRPYVNHTYRARGEGSKAARIHMALNCVSASCPVLPAEAFVPERLDAQLDRETRKFVMEPRNVRVLEDRGVVLLSKIFEWFREDLVDDAGQPLSPIAWINLYREPGTKLDTQLDIAYRDYDWSLNDVTAQRPGVTKPLAPTKYER